MTHPYIKSETGHDSPYTLTNFEERVQLAFTTLGLVEVGVAEREVWEQFLWAFDICNNVE